LRRRTGPPAPAFEALDIRTTDGWSLRAHVYEAADGAIGGRPEKIRGVAVLAHGLASDKRVFDEPHGAGFAQFLARRGWCVVAFDFRGHGESHPHAAAGRCDYDRVVDHDFAAACDYARFRAGPRPVVVVGHGLGGHAALAAAGVAAVDIDAVVAFGAAVWIADLDPSRARQWIRWAGAEGAAWVAGRDTRWPPITSWALRALGRGLGLRRGTARALVHDVLRFTRTGRWVSADRRHDYLASLAAIRVPVLAVASDADLLACPPSSVERLVARCGGRHEVLRICRGDAGSAPPVARGLLDGGRARAAWAHVEAWMRSVPPRSGRGDLFPSEAISELVSS
jgi:pimeloyl-ACP methyl ester carboxylesterase